jgi:hypothetical protein
MNAYCKKVGADVESVRFLFDGQRVKPEQTPEDVNKKTKKNETNKYKQIGSIRSSFVFVFCFLICFVV